MNSPNDARPDARDKNSTANSAVGLTSTFLVGALALMLGVALLSTWLLEAPNHRVLLEIEFSKETLQPVDHAVVLAAIAGKTVAAGLLLVMLCGLLHRRGGRWLARAALHLGLAGLITWIILDMYLLKLTGNHVSDYAGFLLQPGTWQWAGQQSEITRKILTLFAVSGAALAAVSTPGCLLLRCVSRRMGTVGMRRLAWMTTGVSAAIMIAFAPLATFGSQDGRQVSVAVARQLPWPPLGFRWFGPGEDLPFVDDALSRRLSAAYAESFDEIHTASPVDDGIEIDPSHRPNIVVFVLESLRYTAVDAETMPNLARFTQEGVWGGRHYAGSNLSHYGLFSLLYGRSPLVFDQSLDAEVPPQLCHTLRAAGYESSFITSGDCDGWQRMGEFLNDRNFDRVVTHDDANWVDRDRKTLDLTRRIVTDAPSDKPQFVVAFLMCTHFNYEFPPEYAVHNPYAEEVSLISIKEPEKIRNRYRNAAGFLDAAVAETVSQLDLDRTIVAITGDHGESLLEDGKMFHGSKLSEIQTRTPFVLFGSGVPRREITVPTTHADLLPTLLHLLSGESRAPSGCHGRSLLKIESTPGNDHVLLVHGVFHLNQDRHYDRAVFVHEDLRVSLQLWRNAPTVRMTAFVNELDQLTTAEVSPARMARLTRAFDDELAVCRLPPSIEKPLAVNSRKILPR